MSVYEVLSIYAKLTKLRRSLQRRIRRRHPFLSLSTKLNLCIESRYCWKDYWKDVHRYVCHAFRDDHYPVRGCPRLSNGELGYNGKPNGKAQPKQPTRNPTPQPHGKPNPKPDSTAKRKPSGKPNGHVYTWQQFLDQLAQVVDTSEEKLLDVYLPSHPNSMFFENDSDVLPEHRYLPRYWWNDVDGYVCHALDDHHHVPELSKALKWGETPHTPWLKLQRKTFFMMLCRCYFSNGVTCNIRNT